MKLISNQNEVQNKLPSISDFLERKPEETQRSIEFKKSAYSHGSIECKLYIGYSDGRSAVMVSGIATLEGDAFVNAVNNLKKSGVELSVK